MNVFPCLKQVDIVIELQETLPAVYNDPSMVQHIMCRIYCECPELTNSVQGLAIITEQDGQDAVVVFRLPAVEKINGKLLITDRGQDTVEIRLAISSLADDNTS